MASLSEVARDWIIKALEIAMQDAEERGDRKEKAYSAVLDDVVDGFITIKAKKRS